MRCYIALVGLVHAALMFLEMYPWPSPWILANLSGKREVTFSDVQGPFIADIVHNAGIYNAILAGGLLWAAYRGQSEYNVALVLLIGAAVAGAFGAVTLSRLTVLQSLLGIVGAVWVYTKM